MSYVNLQPSEYISFDLFFASVASMQYHPGAGTKEHKKMSLEECRAVALEMVKLRREVVR
jgi:hypothetical protein